MHRSMYMYTYDEADNQTDTIKEGLCYFSLRVIFFFFFGVTPKEIINGSSLFTL
jgi:hypothetical protein